jgi:hypothetical protein
MLAGPRSGADHAPSWLATRSKILDLACLPPSTGLPGFVARGRPGGVMTAIGVDDCFCNPADAHRAPASATWRSSRPGCARSAARLRFRPGGGVRCGPCCTSHRTLCRSRKCAAIDLRIGQGCPIPLAWAASLRRALLYWQAIALPGRRAGSRRCSPLALWLGRDVRCLSRV